MTEEEKKAMEMQTAEGEQPNVAEAEPAPPVPDETADTETPMSAKDSFYKEFGEDNQDVDMDDEEARYSAIGKHYGEYKKMRSGLENLNNLVDESPMFRDMIVAAKEGGKDFNPFKWAAQNRGLDLQALAEDPDYAEAFAESHAAHLKKEAEGSKMKEEAAKNYQNSMSEIDKFAEASGISEKDKGDTLQKVYDMLNDANLGKISVDMFKAIYQGGRHDADVEEAKKQGTREGLAANVTDKLKKIPKPERGGGRQAPEAQPQPTKRNANPFLA